MTHEEETKNFIDPLDDDDEYDEYYDPDDCWECGGEGWITDDCFEDTCCCLDPDAEHGIVPCPKCNPNGTL